MTQNLPRAPAGASAPNRFAATGPRAPAAARTTPPRPRGPPVFSPPGGPFAPRRAAPNRVYFSLARLTELGTGLREGRFDSWSRRFLARYRGAD